MPHLLAPLEKTMSLTPFCRYRRGPSCWSRPCSAPNDRPAAEKPESADARAKRFVEFYETNVRPLEIEAAGALLDRQRLGQGGRLRKEAGGRRQTRPRAVRSQAVCRTQGDQGRRKQGGNHLRRAARPGDRRSLPPVPRQAGRSGTVEEDVGQVERARAGVSTSFGRR